MFSGLIINSLVGVIQHRKMNKKEDYKAEKGWHDNVPMAWLIMGWMFGTPALLLILNPEPAMFGLATICYLFFIYRLCKA